MLTGGYVPSALHLRNLNPHVAEVLQGVSSSSSARSSMLARGGPSGVPLYRPPLYRLPPPPPVIPQAAAGISAPSGANARIPSSRMSERSAFGISSFGAQGTNAHALMSAVAAASSPPPWTPSGPLPGSGTDRGASSLSGGGSPSALIFRKSRHWVHPQPRPMIARFIMPSQGQRGSAVFECPLSHLAYLWDAGRSRGMNTISHVLPNSAVLTGVVSAVQTLLLEQDFWAAEAKGGSHPLSPLRTGNGTRPPQPAIPQNTALLSDVVCAPPATLPGKPGHHGTHHHPVIMRISVDIVRGRVAALLDDRQQLVSHISLPSGSSPDPGPDPTLVDPDPTSEPAQGDHYPSLLDRARALLLPKDPSEAFRSSSWFTPHHEASYCLPFATVDRRTGRQAGKEGCRPTDNGGDGVIVESLMQLALHSGLGLGDSACRGSDNDNEESLAVAAAGQYYFAGSRAVAISFHPEGDDNDGSRSAAADCVYALGPASRMVNKLEGGPLSRLSVGSMSAIQPPGRLHLPHAAGSSTFLRLEGVVLGTAQAGSGGSGKEAALNPAALTGVGDDGISPSGTGAGGVGGSPLLDMPLDERVMFIQVVVRRVYSRVSVAQYRKNSLTLFSLWLNPKPPSLLPTSRTLPPSSHPSSLVPPSDPYLYSHQPPNAPLCSQSQVLSEVGAMLGRIVHLDEPLLTAGIDSRGGMELRQKLAASLGLQLPVTLLWVMTILSMDPYLDLDF